MTPGHRGAGPPRGGRAWAGPDRRRDAAAARMAAVVPARGQRGTGAERRPGAGRGGGAAARRAVGWALALAVAVGGLATLRALAPDRPFLGKAFLVAVAAVVVARLAMWAQQTGEPGAARSAYDRAARGRAGRPPPPDDLRRLEQALWFASAREADLHLRLRPVLREVAELRLAGHGIALDGDQAAVRAALGPELWEVVRRDRAAPADPDAPGLPPAALHALVERLEAI
ncbi:MAG TPA: hypothetical protein VF486_28265 [Actinomycetes bacterium]